MRLYDYSASGNCLKVRLVLGLLRRPYERVAIDIVAGETLTNAFARLNPVRETPVLELDTGAVLTQSAAILTYVGDGSPLVPAAALDRARVVQWLSFEQEHVMHAIGAARFRLLTGRAAPEDPAITARLATGRRALDVLAGALDEEPFVVAGRPSIADLALYPYVSVAGDAGLALAGWPAVASWLERLRALPGFDDDLVRYPENARPGRGRSI